MRQALSLTFDRTCTTPGGMTSPIDSNPSSPSTTWGWRRVRIRPAPQANTTATPKGSPHTKRALRDRRKPLTVTVVYRGGPECWYELRARGLVVRRPGYICIHDALMALEGTY